MIALIIFAAASAHAGAANTDCSQLPGIWEGFFSGGRPANEQYTFAWRDGASGSFSVRCTGGNCGQEKWTYANGQLSADNTTAVAYFPEVATTLTGPTSYNCQKIDWNNTSVWSKVTVVDTVHVVFMSHLDVGFTGLINDVLNLYPSTFYPRAAALSAALRARNGTERFIYTTHPWLLSLFLHCSADNFTLSGIPLTCPNASEQAQLRAAIVSGDLALHAAPFNVEWEAAAFPDMAAAFFAVARDLAAELGITPPRTASVRDVPGVTRGLVPLLAAAGIVALSEGVNSETVAPGLPSPSVWMDPASGASVLYLQHAGGYGGAAKDSGGGRLGDSNCARVVGHPEALCFYFRGEGAGPPDSVDEVLGAFAAFRAEFPNASSVRASTFDAYVEGLLPAVASLPVTTAEAGESWINGVAADPRRVTLYRQGALAYAACLRSGACDAAAPDPALREFLRLFLKTPEHTWGLPTLADTRAWGNAAFRAARAGDPAFARQETSWLEQRNVSAVHALRALGPAHPLAVDIAARMAAWEPAAPQLPGGGYAQVLPAQWTAALTATGTARGDVSLAFDGRAGALAALRIGGAAAPPLADAAHRLGVVVYATLNDTDFAAVANCPLCYVHPGAAAAAAPASSRTEVAMDALWASQAGAAAAPAPRSFLAHATLPAALVADYGAPAHVWLNFTVSAAGAVAVDVLLLGKPATRLGEAVFVLWQPLPAAVNASGHGSSLDARRWRMDKLGSWVDPLDVVPGGAQQQHAVGAGVGFFDTAVGPLAPGGLFIDTEDAPVVCPITAADGYSSLPLLVRPLAGPVTGFASLLFTQAWAMNYNLWSLDEDFRFRFALRVT